jgi:hypothetical protein
VRFPFHLAPLLLATSITSISLYYLYCHRRHHPLAPRHAHLFITLTYVTCCLYPPSAPAQGTIHLLTLALSFLKHTDHLCHSRPLSLLPFHFLITRRLVRLVRLATPPPSPTHPRHLSIYVPPRPLNVFFTTIIISTSSSLCTRHQHVYIFALPTYCFVLHLHYSHISLCPSFYLYSHDSSPLSFTHLITRSMLSPRDFITSFCFLLYIP